MCMCMRMRMRTCMCMPEQSEEERAVDGLLGLKGIYTYTRTCARAGCRRAKGKYKDILPLSRAARPG